VNLICDHCGAPFDGRAGARYCSPAHRKAANRDSGDVTLTAGTLPPAQTPGVSQISPGGDRAAVTDNRPAAHAGHRIHPHAHVPLAAHGKEPARLSACSGRWFCQSCGDAWHGPGECGKVACTDAHRHQHPERGWLAGERCAGAIAA